VNYIHSFIHDKSTHILTSLRQKSSHDPIRMNLLLAIHQGIQYDDSSGKRR